MGPYNLVAYRNRTSALAPRILTLETQWQSGRKRALERRPPTNRNGRRLRRVVALLEKSLAPNARVKHDVKLPCLTTGHEVQCDVVIEIGQEPRVTRTIVEVQKRNKPVKPNDFRGWCEKLRDVGANRLICVSAKPFPRSIKDKVTKELGLRVLLVRLEALEARQWPLQIVNNAMKVSKPHVVEVDDTIKPNPLLMFHPDQNPFKEYTGELLAGTTLSNVIRREGHAELLPLTDLIDEGVRLMNNHPEFLRMPEGVSRVPVRWTPQGVSFCFDGRTAPIQQVEIVYKVEIRSFDFPFEISSYTQEGHDTLAWVVRATGKLDDQDAEIRFTCIPNAEGGFSISPPQFLGIKEGGFLFWRYSNEKE